MNKIELHIFIQDSKTIQILRPPEAPTISGLPTNSLREGDQLTLTCNSHHGNPLPTLKWYRQGEYIQTQVCALWWNQLNDVLTPFSSDLFWGVKLAQRGQADHHRQQKGQWHGVQLRGHNYNISYILPLKEMAQNGPQLFFFLIPAKYFFPGEQPGAFSSGVSKNQLHCLFWTWQVRLFIL